VGAGEMEKIRFENQERTQIADCLENSLSAMGEMDKSKRN
jgi:hypothetical protein